MPGSVQGGAGGSLEQPDLVRGSLPMVEGVGTGWSLVPLPTQIIPRTDITVQKVFPSICHINHWSQLPMSQNNFQTGINNVQLMQSHQNPHIYEFERGKSSSGTQYFTSPWQLLTFAPTAEVIKNTPAVPEYKFAVRHWNQRAHKQQISKSMSTPVQIQSFK